MKRLFVVYVFLLAVFLAMAEDEKLRIAVFDPDSKGTSIDEGTKTAVRELISSTLVNTGKYEIVERSLLEKVMQEQQFSQSGAVDDSQMTEIGKLAGANKVIVPVVTLVEGRKMLSVKMIDVKTASVERQKVKVVTGGLIDVVESLTLELATGESDTSSPFFSSDVQSTSLTTTVDPSKMQVSGKDFIENVNGIQIKMVYVEGGSFEMGATSELESEADVFEKPVRKVSLDSYYMGAFEVTQAQYKAIMGKTVKEQRDIADPLASLVGEGSDLPMYYVSWEEAQAFCEALSRKTGKKYVLPTEAQWEYAARGGKHNERTKYSGDNTLDLVACYGGNSNKRVSVIGSKRANALGICDMSGNVMEWCQDVFVMYKSGNKKNPVGSHSGMVRKLSGQAGMALDAIRVVRGGSWGGNAKSCRVSQRACLNHNFRAGDLGFRVVMIP